MTPKPLCEFFVASCAHNGGIYRFRLCNEGHIDTVQKISMDCPMYLAHENGLLYAVLRSPFAENANSGVLCMQEDGTPVGDIVSTQGEVGCHIAVDGQDIYVSNYISGSVIRLPNELRVHKGSSIHPSRQCSSHAHAVVLSPDKRYLLCCDLGTDQILTYTRDLSLVSTVRTPDRAGPRHLCFSRCGQYVYCINELGGSISLFAWNDGVLDLLDTMSIMPPDFVGEGAGAAIKLSADGSCLYATERASASIITLAVDGTGIKLLSHTDCHGIEPRDFTLLAQDQFAVCTNQFSDNLSLYRIDEKKSPVYLYSVPLVAPLCAIEAGSGTMVPPPASRVVSKCALPG